MNVRARAPRGELVLSSTVPATPSSPSSTIGARSDGRNTRFTMVAALLGICVLLFFLGYEVTPGDQDTKVHINNDPNVDINSRDKRDSKTLIHPTNPSRKSIDPNAVLWDKHLLSKSVVNSDLLSNFEESSSSDMMKFLSFTNETCHAECGRCWLYNETKLFLQITHIVPIEDDNENENDLNYKKYWILIRNINTKQVRECNPRDVTVLIRIYGSDSESSGGVAVADDSSKCGWKYLWKVSQSGEYRILSHLLYYRGYLDFDVSKCKYANDKQYKDPSKDESSVLIKLRKKWRFYGQVEGCCEYCNRMDGKCRSWVSGPGDVTRCVLFTSEKEEMEIIDHWAEREKKIEAIKKDGGNIGKYKSPFWVSGVYRDEPFGWYLGSLLNIQPNDCHMTQLDLIYGSNVEYTVSKWDGALNNEKNKGKLNPYGNDNGLTLCDNVHSNINSRWVSMSHYDCGNSNINAKWDSLCWIQHHKPFTQYYYLPFDCTWKPQIHSEVKQCLKNKSFTKIALAGDSLIRLYSIQVERLIFGKQMRGTNVPNWDYGAKYAYDDMIVWFLGYDDDLDDVSFLEQFIKDKNEQPTVIVHNFQIIHKMWHNNTIEINKALPILAQECDELFSKYYGSNKKDWPARLILESPMLVSEREYHDTADRAQQFNNMLRKSMEPHGWISLPVYHMSESRMYDSSNKKDGVIDGMHMSDNLLLEIGRVMLDMLCRFDIRSHNVNNNPKYMMSSL